MKVHALQTAAATSKSYIFFLEQILASKGDVGVFRCAKKNTTVPKVIL